MRLQDIADAMGDAAQTERTRYHLTLGELVEVLEDQPTDRAVEYEDGASPTGPHSYRGYYSDLAFKATDYSLTTGDVLAQAENALGETFTGYKGGDFTMTENTPLWRAEYSDMGDPIMTTTTTDERIVLVCGER